MVDVRVKLAKIWYLEHIANSPALDTVRGIPAMPRLKVAHLREQEQDVIIVPLDRAFGSQSCQDQDDAITEIQLHGHAAGLAGIVVPVWDGGGGRMAFIAPAPWHPFFRSINPRFVAMNLNRELSW
jgi:hypothetical protein